MNVNTINEGIRVLKEEGMRPFLKEVLVYVCRRPGFLALPYALNKIRGLREDCTLDELLNFVFDSLTGLIIRPMQFYSEISEFLKDSG